MAQVQIDSSYKITALTGEAGDGLSVQYSVNGIGNWHDTFSTGDLYMRQKVGDGAWSNAIRIVGEEGPEPPVYTCELSMSYIGSAVTVRVYKDGVVGTDVYYYADFYGTGENSPSTTGATGQVTAGSATIAAVSNANKHLVRIYSDSNMTDLLCTGFCSYGTTAANGVSYWMIADATTVKLTTEGTFMPPSVSFLARSASGDNGPTRYNGRFVIEYTTDGENWQTSYTSAEDEYQASFIMLPGVVGVRSSLYLAGGTTTLLDQDLIPITEDGEKGDLGTMLAEFSTNILPPTSYLELHNDTNLELSDTTDLELDSNEWHTPATPKDTCMRVSYDSGETWDYLVIRGNDVKTVEIIAEDGFVFKNNDVKELTLTCVATGFTPSRYSWYKDGVEIAGAKNAACVITEAGVYRVLVDNEYSDYVSVIRVTDGTGVTMSQETVEVLCGNGTGTFLGDQSVTIAVYAHKGDDKIPAVITVPSASDGITLTATNGTASSDGSITVSFSNGGNMGAASTVSTTRAVSVLADGITFDFTLKFKKISKGVYLGRCGYLPSNTASITVYTSTTEILGSSSSKIALPGDYISVMYSGSSGTSGLGKVYQWNGSTWNEDGSFDHGTAAMADILMLATTLPSNSVADIFVSRLVANTAFINKLFANQAFINALETGDITIQNAISAQSSANATNVAGGSLGSMETDATSSDVAIHSSDWNPSNLENNTTGFGIMKNGDAYFNNASVRGRLQLAVYSEIPSDLKEGEMFLFGSGS